MQGGSHRRDGRNEGKRHVMRRGMNTDLVEVVELLCGSGDGATMVVVVVVVVPVNCDA